MYAVSVDWLAACSYLWRRVDECDHLIDGKRSNAMTYRSRQHEVMMDVFLDIQMLARCDYLLRECSPLRCDACDMPQILTCRSS